MLFWIYVLHIILKYISNFFSSKILFRTSVSWLESICWPVISPQYPNILSLHCYCLEQFEETLLALHVFPYVIAKRENTGDILGKPWKNIFFLFFLFLQPFLYLILLRHTTKNALNSALITWFLSFITTIMHLVFDFKLFFTSTTGASHNFIS